MAFQGTPVVKALGKYIVRINGISLLGNTSGVIGLFGDTGADIQLPETFPRVADDDALRRGLTYYDLVELRIHVNTEGGTLNYHIHHVDGTDPTRWTILSDTGIDTPPFVLFVHYYHSLTR